MLTARPAEAEARFAFAGLRDLLGEAFDEVVDVLPIPQAAALEVALLRREPSGSATAHAAVAAGLLTTLRVAGGAPACRDRARRRAMVGRPFGGNAHVRTATLPTEPVAVLATRRAALAPGPDLSVAFGGDGVRELGVGPMERLDVEELVRNRSSRPLGRSVVRRVSAAAAGNPFFALEMTQVLAAHNEATADGLLLPHAVTELLQSRLRTLSPGTRQLLGAAALCADATVGVLVKAVAPADARELLRRG